MKLTQRQRENLGKALLNAGNAILVAWVLSNVLGQFFRLRILSLGLGLYVGLILAVLWIDR